MVIVPIAVGRALIFTQNNTSREIGNFGGEKIGKC